MLLSNRVAIITGGVRGIGRGIALKFAEEGCSIVIADVLVAEARKTVEEFDLPPIVIPLLKLVPQA